MKSGGSKDLVEIHIYDDTASSKLSLWGVLTTVGKTWIPNETILLVSSPLYKLSGNGWGAVCLSSTSMIDLNPRFRDGDWLRSYVAGLAKRESLKQDFPEDLWDMEAVLGAGIRIVYSLAEVDGVFVYRFIFDLFFFPDSSLIMQKFLLALFTYIAFSIKKIDLCLSINISLPTPTKLKQNIK